MYIDRIFLVLLCFVFCLCDGAPGGEVNEMHETQPGRYSDEEKKFIVEEVLSLLDEHKAKYSNPLWQKVADKHREKWEQKTIGFSYERSAGSLRHLFQEVLKNKQSQIEGLVPESLIQKLAALDNYKKQRGVSRIRSDSYSPEEEKVIFDELLKPSCSTIFGLPTLELIKAKLDKNRLDNIRGFECDRSIASIRSYLNRSKARGRYPHDILTKFYNHQPGASSSGIPSQNQRTDIEISDERQDEDQWVADMLEDFRNDEDIADEEEDDDDWIADILKERRKKE